MVNFDYMVFQKENANEPQNMKNSDGKYLDIVATLRHHQHPQSHAYNHKKNVLLQSFFREIIALSDFCKVLFASLKIGNDLEYL